MQGLNDSQLDGAVAPTGAGSGAADGARQNSGAEPQTDGQQDGFVPLDESTVVDFVAGKSHLVERLGGADSKSKWRVSVDHCLQAAAGLIREAQSACTRR